MARGFDAFAVPDQLPPKGAVRSIALGRRQSIAKAPNSVGASRLSPAASPSAIQFVASHRSLSNSIWVAGGRCTKVGSAVLQAAVADMQLSTESAEELTRALQ